MVMTYRMTLGCFLVFVLFVVPTRTWAQEATSVLPQPQPQPPAAATAPPIVLAPIVVGEYTCVVGEHAGIDGADARTTADLVCGELDSQKAAGGVYDVHFGKLGTRVLLGVDERATRASRRVLIQSFEEVPTAVRRLVTALATHKSLDETQNVDNVVASESRKPQAKKIATSFELSLVGATAAGVDPGTSAGFALGLMFRSARTSFGTHLRVGGVGSGSNTLTFDSLDLGARYHSSEADTALFVGGGLALSYLKVNRDRIAAPPSGPYGDYYGYNGGTLDVSPSGSGFGAFVEGGIEVLRSSRAGGVLSLRADAPFFLLKRDASAATATGESVSRYVVPISCNIGFRFQ